MFLAFLLFLKRYSIQELKFFIYFGLAGGVAEIVAVYFNVWHYQNPNFFGVPIWLFVLWGIAGIYLGREYEKLAIKLQSTTNKKDK